MLVQRTSASRGAGPTDLLRSPGPMRLASRAHSAASNRIQRHCSNSVRHSRALRPAPDAGPRSVRSLICPRAASQAANVGLFPAGQKQATVELPALMLSVDASSVLNDAQVVDQVNQAAAAGATAIIMRCNTGDGQLYEAAVKLRELLRQRCVLLVQDRNDIANYAAADGVVLSAGGVPVAAARRLLQGKALVGQLVTSPTEAAAAAADGANFVLLQSADGALPSRADLIAARNQQRSGNAIPVIASCTTLDAESATATLPGLAAPADGFAMPLDVLAAAAPAVAAAGEPADTLPSQVATLLQSLTVSHLESEEAEAAAGQSVKVKVPGAGSKLRRLMDTAKESILAEEKVLLADVLSVLHATVPQMEELGLLRTALTALDDVFMVVVVGEFNSGKSTVINALLGEKFLAEGVLPTTNEITVLRYAEPGETQEKEREQQADGLFWRYLPAELLKEMNIVDTPGKNVSIERQERLTEEFVPQADLVLFVMSADRVFSKSEVEFLQYIQQWRKKIVFVINKVDTCNSEDEVQQLCDFAAKNARELLRLEAPVVLPVSGARALKAKLECGSARRGGVLDSWEDDLLQEHQSWKMSKFGEFEKYIYDFLVGSGGGLGAGEGLRLKLQTPLNIADALMGAAARVLEGQVAQAEAELAALQAVRVQLRRFENEMTKDSTAQRQVVKDIVVSALERNAKFVDKTLSLSNITSLTAYLLGPGPEGASGLPVATQFDQQVLAGTFDQMAKQVGEHASWLATNCGNQLSYYTSFLAQRSTPEQAGDTPASSSSSSSSSSGSPASIQVVSSGDNNSSSSSSSSSAGSDAASSSSSATVSIISDPSSCSSVSALSEFKVDAAKMLLEQELKEAVLGTAGAAAGSLGAGLLATSWLPNTLEDALALCVAGLASYVSVLNLPLRRSNIKTKVAKVANNFAGSVALAMEQDTATAVQGTVQQVLGQVTPLEEAWQQQLQQLQAQQDRCQQLLEALQDMQKRTANLQ